MEPKTTRVESENGSVILCEGMEGISLPVEPRVTFLKAIRFYQGGKKVGSADVTVDMRNVPASIHGIALAAIQCCVGNSFHLDALVTKPEKRPAREEGWWDKVKKKWKIRDYP